MKKDDLEFYETTVKDLFTNRRYSIRIAGLTQSLFNAYQYVGNYSIPDYFQLQGRFFWRGGEYHLQCIFK